MNIGILGAGQLGQMLALAGIPLGHRFVFLDPKPDAPGTALAPVIVGPFDDVRSLRELAGRCELVTLDFENVPAASLDALQEQVSVLPGPAALATAQDRLAEKNLFGELAIPTAPYREVDDRAELDAAVAELGFPAVLKTRRLGYDGKGQAVLRAPADLEPAWSRLGGVPLILEGFVDFDGEVSMLAVRATTGEEAFYPLTGNVHRDGILRSSRAPYRDPGLEALARRYAGALLERLEYAGVLAVEFFVQGDALLANEMAPRVHNSGHWTIEGAETSQFENHLRAITGAPLGSTHAPRPAAMLNCIGAEPRFTDVAAVPGAHFHSYGKTPSPGRKLGHITVVADDADQLEQRLARVRPLVDPVS